MKAVITAGGKGTRLSSIAVDMPKPMVKINNKPILEYQIECLKDNNINEIYILIGYLGNTIKDYFKDGKDFGVKITYIEEKEPLGSAGGLYYLKDYLEDDFVFLFGDLMLDVYFDKMIKFHEEHNASITLLSHPNSHPFDSDLIVTGENDRVISIDSKNNFRNYYYHNLVNSGVYVLSSRILKKYFNNLVKIDFEKDVVFEEIKNGSVFSYHSTEYVKDAGTPDRYYAVCEDVNNGIVHAKNLKNKQKCIFVDRDGTLNKYKGFIKELDDIELEIGSADGLKLINQSSYIVIVITNQPVIARGDVTINQLEQFHNKLETLLGNDGAYYDDLFYCPHHPDSGFDGEIKELKIRCDCRKPNIGLLKKAQEKYNIDFSQSFIVGDSTVDIQTGRNANLKTVLVKTGVNGHDGKFDVKPDYIIDSLDQIKNVIGGN